MKNLIAAIALAASAISANADTNSFEYAEIVANQSPVAEACIADTLADLSPAFDEITIMDNTRAEYYAGRIMDQSNKGQNKDSLAASAHNYLFFFVSEGDATAAQANQAYTDIQACVTY